MFTMKKTGGGDRGGGGGGGNGGSTGTAVGRFALATLVVAMLFFAVIIGLTIAVLVNVTDTKNDTDEFNALLLQNLVLSQNQTVNTASLVDLVGQLTDILVGECEVGPERPPHEDEWCRHNMTYMGLGSDAKLSLDNLRRVENKCFTKKRLERGNLMVDCVFDIATQLYDAAFVEGTRVIGPLGTLQADDKYVYGYTGTQGNSLESLTTPELSLLFAIDRSNCELEWAVDATTINTLSTQMVVEKYPTMFDIFSATEYERSPYDGNSFGPITLFDKYIVTGDGAPGNYFFTDDYYDSLPQANGGPILGKTWGITNYNRHLMHQKVYLIRKSDGELLDADFFADFGDAEGQGYCNPFAQSRMMVAFEDHQRNNQKFVLTTTSNGFRQGKWTLLDPNITRIEIGLMNGNREVKKGGRATLFRIKEKFSPSTGELVSATLKEVWRYYGSPRMLFEGDLNPYYRGYPGDGEDSYGEPEYFPDDTEAEIRNFHNDGLWSQRPLVDLEYRQVVIGGGNGLQMPIEEIVAAKTADDDEETFTGASSYPNRCFRDWYLLFKQAEDEEDQRRLYDDFKYTQKKMLQNMVETYGNRIFEFAANSVIAIDLDTGELKWTHKNVVHDTWVSLLFYAQNYDVNDLPTLLQFMYVGGGGDYDYGIGPVKTKYGYSTFGKDGSMQLLEPRTGDVIYDQKITSGVTLGGFNYQLSSDGEYAYGGISFYTGLDFLADKNHCTILNEFGYPEFTEIESFSGVPSIYANSTPTWWSSEVKDPFGQLRNIPGDYLNNIQVNAAFESNTAIAKIHVPTGKVITMNLMRPVNTPGSPLSVSVNDLLVTSSLSGFLYVWDADTMDLLWEYDIRPDITNPMDIDEYPGNDEAIVINSPPIVVGREIWMTFGEYNFWGNSPGKYLYKFKLNN